MESKLLSSPDASVAGASITAQQTETEVDTLAEVREVIAADCRIEPKEYLDEVRVAAGGE